MLPEPVLVEWKEARTFDPPAYFPPSKRSFSSISVLDFRDIKRKLCAKLGWDEAYANAVEDQYKEFLVSCLSSNEELEVPSKDVDEVWHAHILDTKRYHADCQRIFGHYLHHQPTYGEEPFCRNNCKKECMKQCHHLPFPDPLGPPAE